MSDGWKYLPEYGISVRPDGAVMTPRKKFGFGYDLSRGYRGVRTRSGCKQVHRLVMEAFCGPSDLQVNHRNGIRDDNRLSNLEYCTNCFNVRHGVERRDVLGCYQTKSGMWSAKIAVSGVQVHLGTFVTEQDAHDAYIEARKEMWHEEAKP